MICGQKLGELMGFSFVDFDTERGRFRHWRRGAETMKKFRTGQVDGLTLASFARFLESFRAAHTRNRQPLQFGPNRPVSARHSVISPFSHRVVRSCLLRITVSKQLKQRSCGFNVRNWIVPFRRTFGVQLVRIILDQFRHKISSRSPPSWRSRRRSDTDPDSTSQITLAVRRGSRGTKRRPASCFSKLTNCHALQVIVFTEMPRLAAPGR
jgi:hypothetical protein